MKKNQPKQTLKPIKTERQTPEDKRLEKFVSEHSDLAGKAIAKWLQDDKNK